MVDKDPSKVSIVNAVIAVNDLQAALEKFNKDTGDSYDDTWENYPKAHEAFEELGVKLLYAECLIKRFLQRTKRGL